MKTKSIRLCALVLTMVMVLSCGASALDYGQEWAGASTPATASYTDVAATHWAWDSIQRVSAKNWFSGYPDGTFRPNGTITRAEALKVFVVFLGLEVSPVTQSSFYDVSASAWYAPYVEAGKDLFPVHTTIQGKTPFQPDMPVTREDTIYALVNALGYGNDVSVVDESVLNMFTDQNSISRSLRPYFAVALQNQLVAGYTDSTIRAQNSLTRAEFATLLYRGSFVGSNDTYTAKISTVTPFPSGETAMAIGESLTLSARATYTDGTNQAYTGLQPYDASNNGVISLSGATVTALKEGTATIKYNDSYLKNETLTITVKTPTDVPVIKITDYAATTESDTVSVVGTVSDANLSTLSLTVGGKDIIPGSNGSFQTVVSLNVGVNTITFVATNQYGVTAQRSITITRTEVQQTQNNQQQNNNQNTQQPTQDNSTQDNVQDNVQDNSTQDNTQDNTQNNTQNNQQNNNTNTQTPQPIGKVDLTTQNVMTTKYSWIIKDLNELTVPVGQGKNVNYVTYKSGFAYSCDLNIWMDNIIWFNTLGFNTLEYTLWAEQPNTPNSTTTKITLYGKKDDGSKEEYVLDSQKIDFNTLKSKVVDISGFDYVGIAGKKSEDNAKYADIVAPAHICKILDPVIYNR